MNFSRVASSRPRTAGAAGWGDIRLLSERKLSKSRRGFKPISPGYETGGGIVHPTGDDRWVWAAENTRSKNRGIGPRLQLPFARQAGEASLATGQFGPRTEFDIRFKCRGGGKLKPRRHWCVTSPSQSMVPGPAFSTVMTTLLRVSGSVDLV